MHSWPWPSFCASHCVGVFEVAAEAVERAVLRDRGRGLCAEAGCRAHRSGGSRLAKRAQTTVAILHKADGDRCGLVQLRAAKRGRDTGRMQPPMPHKLGGRGCGTPAGSESRPPPTVESRRRSWGAPGRSVLAGVASTSMGEARPGSALAGGQPCPWPNFALAVVSRSAPPPCMSLPPRPSPPSRPSPLPRGLSTCL